MFIKQDNKVMNGKFCKTRLIAVVKSVSLMLLGGEGESEGWRWLQQHKTSQSPMP